MSLCYIERKPCNAFLMTIKEHREHIRYVIYYRGDGIKGFSSKLLAQKALDRFIDSDLDDDQIMIFLNQEVSK